MKLKCILIFVFSIGLCGCPGEMNEYFTIDSFSVQSVIAESCEVLSEVDSIKWDEFAILLNFKTSQELSASKSLVTSNMVHAAYSGHLASSSIINITIKKGNASEKYDVSNKIHTYRYKEFYKKTIACLNIMASSNYEEQWVVKENDISKNYLKLNEPPNKDFTGKFYVELKLEDGSILKDSTQTITITR